MNKRCFALMVVADVTGSSFPVPKFFGPPVATVEARQPQSI